jgi:hypothetical protein
MPFAFLGGAVLGLLVDHPELMEIRPTKDVDVIVEIVTLREFYAMEERLGAGGFQHDTSEGAPICRWIVEGCRVDVMPMDMAPAQITRPLWSTTTPPASKTVTITIPSAARGAAVAVEAIQSPCSSPW